MPEPLTPDTFLMNLPTDRQAPMKRLHETIIANLPEGFEATIGYGMLAYVVPHSIYPKGYHTNPKLPLPFVSLGSQKNFIVLHHLGLYADTALAEWFGKEYAKVCKTKMDMGKGCVRFKKMDDIPYDLISQLMQKFTVQEWIRKYEGSFTKKR